MVYRAAWKGSGKRGSCCMFRGARPRLDVGWLMESLDARKDNAETQSVLNRAERAWLVMSGERGARTPTRGCHGKYAQSFDGKGVAAIPACRVARVVLQAARLIGWREVWALQPWKIVARKCITVKIQYWSLSFRNETWEVEWMQGVGGKLGVW